MSCICGSTADRHIDDLLGGARYILDTGGPLLSLSPIPGLDVAASALSSLIGMIQQTRGNEGTREELAEDIKRLANLIDKTVRQASDATDTHPENEGKGRRRLVTSPELKERIDSLIQSLEELKTEAAKLQKGSFFSRCIHSSSNADALSKLTQGLKDAIRDFQVQGQVTIEMLVNGVVEKLNRVDDNIEVIKQDQQVIRRKQEEDLDSKVLENLPYVNARYTSSLNPTTAGVLPGTRGKVLEEISLWTHGPDSNGYDPIIYVLSGGAGTGKSTLAFEVADRLDKSKMLGASFFFVRDAEKLNTTRHILATIAYQLARTHTELYPHIVAAARAYAEQGKHGQQLEFDLEDLIIEPLKKVSPSHPRLIVVIDAVDECTESDQVVRLLYLLARRLPDIPFPLRVFVTSRPEMHIQDALNSTEFRQAAKPFMLHDVPMAVVDEDIAQFLYTKLENLSCWKSLVEARPNIIQDLTQRSAGIFIYAATVVSFLNRNTDDAIEILDDLLSENPSEAGFSLRQLDRLYLTVLRSAFSEDDIRSPRIRERIQVVLGSLAVLRDRVSMNVLKDLVGASVKDIRYTLRHLASVIHIPENENDDIRMLHASFPQFLMDRERCDNDTFYINPAKHHARMASHCLTLMTRTPLLKENICKIGDRLVHKKDVPDLQDRVKTFIPAHLKYACSHWASHLSNSESSTELLGLLTDFSIKKLIVWLEVLSYLNRLNEAVPALLAAHGWYKDNAGDTLNKDIVDILYDGYRLVLEFYLPISACPEQLYNSALPLGPPCKLVNLFSGKHVASNSIVTKVITPRAASGWGACLRTIEMSNEHFVFCARYSPDGRAIATGSTEGVIHIWDASTGLLKKTLSGHTEHVLCVAWAPDGRKLVSGARDSTFRVWDAASGAQGHVQRVQEGDCWVADISWTPEGKHIISGTKPGGLQIWDASTFQEIASGRGIIAAENTGTLTFATIPMAVSKDSTWAADVTEDWTVRIWNLDHSGGKHKLVNTLEGPKSEVSTLTFLHDDAHIAACANLTTIHVWNVETGQAVRSMDMNTGVMMITVSQKGDIIASTSSNHTVELRNSETWELIDVLGGHTNIILSISFSPDGDHLVSSSIDNTVKIWDLSQRAPASHDLRPISTPNPLPQYDSRMIVASQDGTHAATISSDNTTIWSLRTGKQIHVLPGNTDSTAVFSPDSKKLAVTRGGEEPVTTDICVWNLATPSATMERSISGTQGKIGALAWSSDGLWIACCVNYVLSTSFCVRDARTGDLTAQHTFNFVPEYTKGSDYMEFSEDSTMLYVKGMYCEAIFKWKEGEILDLESNRWMLQIEGRRFYEDGGWVVRKEDGKRACWLPGVMRSEESMASPRPVVECGEYYAVLGSLGQLTVLQFAAE